MVINIIIKYNTFYEGTNGSQWIAGMETICIEPYASMKQWYLNCKRRDRTEPTSLPEVVRKVGGICIKFSTYQATGCSFECLCIWKVSLHGLGWGRTDEKYERWGEREAFKEESLLIWLSLKIWLYPRDRVDRSVETDKREARLEITYWLG